MTASSKATAIAPPNLALVKYWGKRDEALVLPHQSSVSVALAPLEVKATVAFGSPADEVVVNGRAAEGSERSRVLSFLQHVREAADLAPGPARVATAGNFPAAAGLASSAAAFAALAVAAADAAGLRLDSRAASRLARLGSGSACRSVPGGFSRWRRGARPDGTDSEAELLFPPEHWLQLRVLVAVMSRAEKAVKSRDGMRRTVETSPYYPAWIEDAELEVDRACDLIRRHDLEGLGQLSERNAFRMHAAALAADPAVCYLQPKTLELILALPAERRRGIPVWFSLDAGPNPALLTDADHELAVAQIASSAGAVEVVRCRPGLGARLVSQHLF